MEAIQEPIRTIPTRTRTKSPIVTGTSCLALQYKEGVLLAADTLASYGSLSRFKDVERIVQLSRNTLVAAGGDLSDFQEILKKLKALIKKNKAAADGHELQPEEVHSYLVRLLSERRSKVDPFWVECLVAGRSRDGNFYLGYCDLNGTSLKDSRFATGIGSYLALPLLRDTASPENINEEGARARLEESMKVLLYRDCRTINRIQFAVVNEDGIRIEEPVKIHTEWDHFGAYHTDM